MLGLFFVALSLLDVVGLVGYGYILQGSLMTTNRKTARAWITRINHMEPQTHASNGPASNICSQKEWNLGGEAP